MEGTGLGLSICQGIVERMGGELWFKSKNKIGTAFHFNVILEYDINDLINLEAENLLSRQLSQLSALIVSADELSCAHYSNALKNWGMKVESISTLNNLNLSKHYDILVVNLIIDLTTPEELQIEKFKNEITSLQKDLPILVITPNYLSQFDQLLKKVKFKHLKRGDTFGKLLDSLLFVLANKNVTSHSLNLEHHNNSELNNEQKTILIVEDNLINQKVASKTLLSRGYHVLIADNGKLAIDALDNNSIDLVLMDLEMPIMGGLEAVQIIRSSSTNYKSVPVIALTAHAMESTKSKCIESGMNDFLAKPFKLNELIETIEANLFNESE
jgi:two-component system sensor histidine kinase/response regulator